MPINTIKESVTLFAPNLGKVAPVQDEKICSVGMLKYLVDLNWKIKLLTMDYRSRTKSLCNET